MTSGRPSAVVRFFEHSKRVAKSLLGRFLFGLSLHRRLLDRTATVVEFHRVNDDWKPDAMNCSLARFTAYCRFFRKHFSVVPLTQIVSKLEAGAPLAGELAITFDDGYRDNCAYAAPILKSMGLPATFFVVTGFIGSETVPGWDKTAGQKHPWMSWDQVTALRDQGFDIGSHSLSHPDFAAIPLELARRELVQSRRELENVLHRPVELFAYPYGEPWNMTDEALQEVKDAGFRCSAGGFGGVNLPGGDPFRLKRVPISSWYASPWHLAGDLLTNAFKGRFLSRPRGA